jgi:cell division protein FtsL
MERRMKRHMKPGRFWTLMIVAAFFALGMVWQSSRFADLKARAGELESVQEEWIAKNRKVEAQIALLSSRERAEAMASRLGLRKVLPEDRIKVTVQPGGKTHD